MGSIQVVYCNRIVTVFFFCFIRMSLADRASAYDSAWNRINSTEGALVRDNASFGMFNYTQIPEKFTHPKQTRNALGLVGGNEVSNISGSAVDLESDLFGITRNLTKCAPREYIPACPLGGKDCPAYPSDRTFIDRATGVKHTIRTAPRDLPTSQFTSYPGVGSPIPLQQSIAYPRLF
jgi:hypothetical protein